MQVHLSTLSFCGKPNNYAVIDNYLSRSAQPQKEDFAWLKEQGVTDVFNFRTMYAPAVDFNEQEEVEKLGMKYHNIPSITREPSEANIKTFLSEVDKIAKQGGKAHIHCKAGADRTGMYAFIYKTLKGVDSRLSNQLEWMRMGHDYIRYEGLMQWANNFINKMLRAKK